MNEWNDLKRDLENYLLRQSMSESEMGDLGGVPVRLQDTEAGKLLTRLKTKTSREYHPTELGARA